MICLYFFLFICYLGFEGRVLVLVVSVPGHGICFTFFTRGEENYICFVQD